MIVGLFSFVINQQNNTMRMNIQPDEQGVMQEYIAPVCRNYPVKPRTVLCVSNERVPDEDGEW